MVYVTRVAAHINNTHVLLECCRDQDGLKNGSDETLQEKCVCTVDILVRQECMSTTSGSCCLLAIIYLSLLIALKRKTENNIKSQVCCKSYKGGWGEACYMWPSQPSPSIVAQSFFFSQRWHSLPTYTIHQNSWRKGLVLAHLVKLSIF